MAFFPCIYFCENNQLYFTGKHRNLSKLTASEKELTIIERADNRNRLYILLLKLFHICTTRSLRMIVENPYSTEHYLYMNFPYAPRFIDYDRTKRGDFFKKPSQYFFHNCEPTYGKSYTKPEIHKAVTSMKPGIRAGICSEDRSLISPDYARNFICDFIIGKKQPGITELSLFD